MSVLGAKKNQNVDWKEKYYQSLDKIDEQEKSFAASENELTKSLLKLTFAHTGFSPELDKELKEFRDKLRTQTKPDRRKKLINNIVDKILNVTEEKPDEDNLGASETLISFLDQLQIDAKHTPAINQLKTKLNQSDSKDDISRYSQQTSNLINELISSDQTNKTSNDQKNEEFTEFLKRLNLYGERREKLKQLEQNFNSIADVKERLDIVQQVVDLIHTLENSNTPNETDDSLEVILQLLEWISIPENFTAELAELKEDLIPEIFNSNRTKVLQSIGNFLSRINKNLQSELVEMETYLSKVIERLKEFENHLMGSKSKQQESLAEALNFNDQMKENAEKLKEDINSCNNIDEIKITLDSHLEIIDANLDIHLKSEQERQQESQKAIESLAKRVVQIESESQKLQDAIIEERQKALKDALTGICNRLAYEEKIEDEFSRWLRYGNNLSLGLIDIDDFKKINDQYGHSAGDKVLKTVAKLSDEKIRTSDFIARFGGEEFILIFPNTKIDEAIVAAENLRKTIDDCVFHYKQKAVPITISIGIAEFHEGDDIDTVLNRADNALYSAKHSGKNRCEKESL